MRGARKALVCSATRIQLDGALFRDEQTHGIFTDLPPLWPILGRGTFRFLGYVTA